jgi:hypothetical protein
MSAVALYRAFKADLLGFTEVPFDEFRARVLPLRPRREWSPAMATYAEGLRAAGAGRALQRLCGLRHPAAAKILGAAELGGDPMTRSELDGHMRALVKSCQQDGWPAARFAAFAAYLDSDMTPAQLAQLDQKTQHPVAHTPAVTPSPRGAPPASDRFAEMYRAASPAFKRAVREHLTRAGAVGAA